MKGMQEKTFISVCMIVKDEEEFMEGCLIDIKNIADEIIIIDTGSTDSTLEIARRYTDLVFTKTDSGSKDIHRQFCIEKVSCPWILLINSYERLEASLKSNIAQLISADYDVYMLPVVKFNARFAEMETPESFQPRLFKRDAITWSQDITSQPVYHTNKAAKVNDGYILDLRKSPGLQMSGKKSFPFKEYENGSIPKTYKENEDNKNQHYDLLSHLHKLEKINQKMDNNEAMYRFLYHLSIT